MDNNDILLAMRPHMQDWFERPEHLDLIIAEPSDATRPHGQLRFLDEVDDFHKWYWLELRYLDRDIDSNAVQLFVDTFPEKRPPVRRLMLTTKSFTQSAIVLAQQHGVECIRVAYDPRTRDHGYLKPVITVQNVHSPQTLSQREWNVIHDRLADSLKDSSIEAVLAGSQGNPSYRWHHLRDALPIAEPYDESQDYRYDLPGYELQVSGLKALPIEGVTFRYHTHFQPLEGEDKVEALTDLLKDLLLDRV